MNRKSPNKLQTIMKTMLLSKYYKLLPTDRNHMKSWPTLLLFCLLFEMDILFKIFVDLSNDRWNTTDFLFIIMQKKHQWTKVIQLCVNYKYYDKLVHIIFVNYPKKRRIIKFNRTAMIVRIYSLQKKKHLANSI